MSHENAIVEDRQQSIASEPCEVPKTAAKAEPKGLAKRVLMEEKPIKVYPFTVDKLSEENTRYWFYTIKQQLRIQYT